MEYHELGDLQHLDDASRCPGKRLPEHDVHDISLQVLDALCLMYEQGFSHRDLKPAVSDICRFLCFSIKRKLTSSSLEHSN